jgi:carbon storage regulator
MLVLSRKAGESIKIGDGITVVVNRIAGNRVTLGLEAPRHLRIIRGELTPFDDESSPECDDVNSELRIAVPIAVGETHDAAFMSRKAR